MPEVTFAMDTKMPRLSVSAGNGPEHGQSLDNILGFKITGGYEFQMPITIFHVKEDSRADKAGLKLGDSIVAINGQDTTNMTLQEANTVLEQTSQQDVKLGITKFDEVDDANPTKKPTIHEVLLAGKRKSQRLPFEHELQVPRDAYIEKPGRKSWHPIMWPHPECILPESFTAVQNELPHKRIIRNLRKLLTDIADKPAERERHLESILLALPRGSADPRPKAEQIIAPIPAKQIQQNEDEDASEEEEE
ncbi:unnamed protein product [Diamesa tonsa]